MKVPLKWLKDAIETRLAPNEIARQMTMAGLEAEKLEELGEHWDKVYVGVVEGVERHPDADRLVLADVDAGEHRLRVVTGAPNIAAGQRVALAIMGARLVDAYADTLQYKTLKPGVIRGIKSEGMVCSEKELGLSDEHEGILVLEPNAPVGMPLREYLGDTVIEFEITPNLVHAFSIVGLARQLHALTGETLTVPAGVDHEQLPVANDSLVAIGDEDLCFRFAGAVIENIHVEPSPIWLQRRLQAAGLRPINNIVDVTNYVMLEFGQPLHAYDRATLAGGALSARRARTGETLETLDHQARALNTDMLVIADADGPVGVAGVMGGFASEVTENTREILLEAANFDMKSVRHTARELKLRTDASARFERGLSPDLVGPAIARALKLLRDVSPEARITQFNDVYPKPVQQRTISMPVAKIERVLGVSYPERQVMEVLDRLDFSPGISGPTESRELTVTVPTDRQDVAIHEDLIEEIARIIGYDTLPETLPFGTLPEVRRDPLAQFQHRIRRRMAQVGASEAITYTPVSASMLRWLDNVESTDAHDEVGVLERVALSSLLRLRNPLRIDRNLLRISLLPSLLEVAAQNRKHAPAVRMFELGSVYLPTDRDALPIERPTLAIVYAGQRETFDLYNQRGVMDFTDMKGTIEAILDHIAVEGEVVIDRGDGAPRGFHPGRTAAVSLDGERIGIFGELRPDVASRLGFEDARVMGAELNIQVLFDAQPTSSRAVSVPRFLPVEQDFAVVVDRDTPARAVREALLSGSSPLSKAITLFDVFEGEQLGEGKKSLAYRITFEAPDRALTDADLTKTRSRIERTLKQRVRGSLRG